MARIFRHSGTLDFQNVIFSKNSLFRKFGIPLLFLRFRLFAEKLPADGTLIINSDTPEYEKIIADLPCEIV